MHLRILGGGLCWLLAAAACAAAPPPVRVSIHGHLGRVSALTIVAPGKSRAVDAAENRVLAEVGAGAAWSVSQGAARRLRCTVKAGGAQQSFETSALRIEGGDGSVLRVRNGRAERGYPEVLEIRTGASGWTVINEAPVEQYVQGVLAGEVSERWHPEALKALAVAARSYTERNRGRHGELFDLCDTTHCHCYTGLAGVGERIRGAVAATAGIVALWEGRPIDAVYSADCGGRTQTVRDAWGSNREFGYLRSVIDAPEEGGPEYCAINPKHAWNLTLTPSALEQLLNRKPQTRVGTLRRVEAVGVTESGRPAAVEFVGGAAEIPPVSEELPCELAEKADAGKTYASALAGAAPIVRLLPISQFRQLLGAAAARGSMLQLQPAPDGGLRVEGKGSGHGVGLCQYGAQGMAAGHGKSWEEILYHYYRGIALGPTPKR